jgi:hypothetical protein
MTRKYGHSDTNRFAMESGKTVLRWESEIPNERDQKHQTNSKLNFFKQKSVVPVQVTGGNSGGTRTMNAGGVPFMPAGKPDE